MKLNPCKAHSISISCSRTPHPPLTLCGIDLEVSSSFKLIGVTIDNKLTFEKHFCNNAFSIAPKNWSYSQMLQNSWQ